MARRRSGSHVGMSFVDTLTCGIGAMVLLWMAQLTRPEPQPRFGGTGSELRIGLDPTNPGPAPLLAVRLQRGGGRPQSAAEIGPSFGVTVAEPEDGRAEYTLRFSQDATFAPDDRLLVYLYDLNGRRFNDDVKLKARRVGGAKPDAGECDPPDSVRPSGVAPLLTLPLADAEGQTGLMTWQLHKDGRTWRRPFAEPAAPAVVLPPKPGEPPKPPASPHDQHFVVDLLDSRQRNHKEWYRFTAVWDDPARTLNNDRIATADKLAAVTIHVGKEGPRATTITLDGRDGDPAAAALARQALAFFWNEFPPDEPVGGKPPRFDLAPARGKGQARVIKPTVTPLAQHTYEHVRESDGTFRLKYPGLQATLELLLEAGAEGGQLQLLIEAGKEPHQFVLVRRPAGGDPWRGGRLASPGLTRAYDLVMAEPLPPVGRMPGVARLPSGTWTLLEEVDKQDGSLLALGTGGLVTAAAGHAPPFVMHARSAAADQLYKRHETNGLTTATGPPAWSNVFPMPAVLLRGTPSGEAVEMVAVSICSRNVWAKPRPTAADPSAKDDRNRPLPLHPELWALPPVPTR